MSRTRKDKAFVTIERKYIEILTTNWRTGKGSGLVAGNRLL